MNRRFSLLKISLNVIKGRNVSARMISICSIVLIIVPMVLQGVSQSIMSEAANSNKDVYGEFTDVWYTDASGQSIDAIRQEADDVLRELSDYTSGIIYSVIREKQEDFYINAGYADAGAIKLGRIKALQGAFPDSRQEIAVTRGLLEKMGLELRPGQTITFHGETYELAGIIEDYGQLWPRRTKEIEDGIAAADIFLSKETAEEMIFAGNEVLVQVLINRSSYESITDDRGELIRNINSLSSLPASVFQVPRGLFAMLYLCELFIFYHVLLLSYARLHKRCMVYSSLGMTKTDISLCLAGELFGLLFFSTCIGAILGLGITKLVKAVLSRMFFMNMRLNDLWQNLSAGLFFLVLAVPCLILFTGKLLNHLDGTSDRKGRSRRSHYRKYGFWRLTFSEFQSQKNICIFLVLLISACTAFLGYSIMYKNYFADEASYKQYNGEMPFDYDIEFAVMPRESAISMDDPLYFDNTYEHDGATEELVSRLRSEDGIDKILSYKENNKIRLLLDKDQTDRYLTASDYTDNETYSPITMNNRINDVFGYGDQLLVQTKLAGYHEDEIRQFEAYVTEGSIDIEKLNSGEEVILVAPPYMLTKQDDGGIRKSHYQPGTPGTYRNTLLHAGNEITLTRIESSIPYNRGVDRKTLETSYQRKDQTAVIGAVVEAYVGWFGNDTTIGETYFIYTTQTGFEHLGIDATYNRLRIYMEASADYDRTAEIIRNYSSELPYMHMQDLRRELETYRRLKLLIELYCLTLMILVILVFSLCISGQMLVKTRLNLRKYALLRLNGLSVRKLTGMLMIQLLLLGGLGIIISVPLMWIAIARTLRLSFSIVKQYFIPSEMLGALGILIPFFLIAALPSAVLISRARIKDEL